jgi:hypothetical protein
LVNLTKLGGVGNDTHEDSGNETSKRDGENPSKVTPGNHSPVDGLDGSVTQTDGDNGTDNALGGGDGQVETGGHDGGDGGAKLHGETSRGGLHGHLVTKVGHEVVSVSPQTNDKGARSVDQDPHGHIGLLSGLVGGPDLVDGGQGTDSVGDIVRTVGKRGSASGDTLEEGVQSLDLVVVLLGLGEHLSEIAGQSVAGGLLGGNDIDGPAVRNGLPEELGPVLGVSGQDLPGLVDGLEGGSSGGVGSLVLLGLDRLDTVVLLGVGGDHQNLLLLVLGEVIALVAVEMAVVLQVLLLGSDKLVVVDHVVVSVHSLGHGGHFSSVVEHGTVEDVPGSQGVVLLDELSVEEGLEEDSVEQGGDGSDTDDGADGGTGGQLVELEVGGSLPHNQHGEHAKGDADVDVAHPQGISQGVLSLQNNVLGNEVDEGSKASGNGGGNEPRGDNLGESLPAPVDSSASVGGDGGSDDGADDGVCGGNGDTEPGSDGEPNRGADKSAHHEQHEAGGGLSEGVNVNDLVSNGIGDSGTGQYGTEELADGGENHGLPVLEGSRRDRGGKGVGDIVGSNVPRVQEREDHRQREDVVELVKSGHCRGVCGGRIRWRQNPQDGLTIIYSFRGLMSVNI